MAVLSALRSLPKTRFGAFIAKNGGQTRLFHEGEEFPMRPTVFQWRKFKDFLHFYMALGIIPLTIITTYVNITIGPAELAEIPDGYEPKYWEYFKSPVSRFMAKYIIGDKRIDYEGMVDLCAEESEKMVLKNVERIIRDFMKNRSDYQSWYYRPIDAYHFRFEREEWKYIRDHLIGESTDVADEKMFSDGGSPK